MAPHESLICGGNFPKRKNSAALCEILRIVTIYITLTPLAYSSICASQYQDPAGMHCPSWDDAFVSSYVKIYLLHQGQSENMS